MAEIQKQVVVKVLTPMLLLSVLAVAVAFAQEQGKKRVFVTDSTSWEIAGGFEASNGTAAGQVRGGARPQTAEVIKTFGERCPAVVVTMKPEKADYVALLDHEGGKGYLRHRNKVAVFSRAGDAIYSRSTRSLGNGVKDACDAILKDAAQSTAGRK